MPSDLGKHQTTRQIRVRSKCDQAVYGSHAPTRAAVESILVVYGGLVGFNGSDPQRNPLCHGAVANPTPPQTGFTLAGLGNVKLLLQSLDVAGESLPGIRYENRRYSFIRDALLTQLRNDSGQKVIITITASSPQRALKTDIL